MLVTFIGSPSSGKTTVAATVFAELKKTGMPVEFVTERARLYIARLRQCNKQPIILTDTDQLAIMEMQMADEETMCLSNPNGIVISDSSALNSLFYMSPDCRKAAISSRLNKLYNAHTLCYYCEPLLQVNILDPNRIHSIEESLKIDEIIRSYNPGNCHLNDTRPIIFPFIKKLVGPPNMRSNDVLRDVYEGFTNA